MSQPMPSHQLSLVALVRAGQDPASLAFSDCRHRAQHSLARASTCSRFLACHPPLLSSQRQRGVPHLLPAAQSNRQPSSDSITLHWLCHARTTAKIVLSEGFRVFEFVDKAVHEVVICCESGQGLWTTGGQRVERSFRAHQIRALGCPLSKFPTTTVAVAQLNSRAAFAPRILSRVAGVRCFSIHLSSRSHS